MKKFFLSVFVFLGIIFLALTLLVSIGIYSLTKSTRIAKIEDNSVLYLALKEEINEYEDDNIFSISTSHLGLIQAITTLDVAAKDPKIKGVFINLRNCPLGFAQVQEMREAFKSFRSFGKFIYAYSDTFGETGNDTLSYYLATACDRIYMMEAGAVAPLGFFMETPFIKEVLDKYKIEPEIGQREKYKSFFEFTTQKDFTDATRENYDSLLSDLMDQLLSDIAKDRNVSKEEVKSFIDSAPHLSKEAVKNKFIDRLMYFDEVKQEIKAMGSEKSSIKLVKFHDYFLNTEAQKTEQPNVALIHVDGTITRTSAKPLGGNIYSSDLNIIDGIKKADKDSTISAILIRVNTGGGSAVASENIWRAIKCCHKLVVVSFSDTAASGGYYLATACPIIIAHPGTITGSIGVVSGKFITNGFWESLGVNWKSIQKGDNADYWTSNQKFNENQRKIFDQGLDFVYDLFKKRVADGRNLDLGTVQDIAQGRVWTGRQAKNLKLVDALGGLSKAFSIIKEKAGLEEIRLKTFPESFGFWDVISSVGDSSREIHTKISQNLRYAGIMMGIVKQETLEAPTSLLKMTNRSLE